METIYCASARWGGPHRITTQHLSWYLSTTRSYPRIKREIFYHGKQGRKIKFRKSPKGRDRCVKWASTAHWRDGQWEIQWSQNINHAFVTCVGAFDAQLALFPIRVWRSETPRSRKSENRPKLSRKNSTQTKSCSRFDSKLLRRALQRKIQPENNSNHNGVGPK